VIWLKKVEIKPDIFWVGGIDWDIRNFHGYTTNRGTTYNSYLITDKKITLIDTVKYYKFDEMIARIREIVDPNNIDYIVTNHVEMDHSGSLPKILEITPNAKIITSKRGKNGLLRHYKKEFSIQIVNSGDSINIGKRTLNFLHIPMVHWPDSMVTYVPNDKILFPNDAFGQHIAGSIRFDDEIDWGIIHEEAAKYYANIVMPYGEHVKKALDLLAEMQINIIAPSHGIIWRKNIPEILKEYNKWATYTTENKALIVYDSMWGSTEKMAYKLAEGIEEVGIHATIRNLKTSHISDVMTDVLTTKLIIIGSPTMNNSMLPSIGGFLTYLKGLRPRNRVGFAFGSYGWGGQAVGEIENKLQELKWDLPEKSIKLNYIPNDEEFIYLMKIGNNLGRYLKKNN
jgi:flavorubredoxin